MAAMNDIPPFFRNGPTPFSRLCFYVACSLTLFILDLRFHTLEAVRQTVYGVMEPLRAAAQTPVELFNRGSGYFRDQHRILAENEALKNDQLKAAPILERYAQLEVENKRLTTLLDIETPPATTGQVARVLYTARDPFSRRVYLDKGMQQNIQSGSPVIDHQGVIGQITRVFPFSAEVTLLTDKNQTVPVQVRRTGQRSFIFGLGNGFVELKYIPINADIRPGDLLVTSGIDGVYQPGFPVAQVTEVTHDSDDAFARIIAKPLSAVENQTIVMVLSAHAPPLSPEEAAPKAQP